MSDAPQSPAQAAMIAIHLMNGRLSAAILLAALPTEFFTGMDRIMEAAFVAGMAAAMQSKEEQDR